MIVLFVAPKSTWRRALAAETRAALDAGHTVRAVAEEHPDFDLEPLDPRVEVRWTGAGDLSAPEPRLTGLLLRRIPLGTLRRIGRGPLRGPADRLARRWRRAVLDPLQRRRRSRTETRRAECRLERIRTAVADWEPDWIVLHEPAAVELGVHWLPGLLDARPGLTTSFSFEPPPEPGHEH